MDTIISGVTDKAKTGVRNVWNESTANRGSTANTIISAPGRMVASIGVETGRFALHNISAITTSVVGSIAKLGLGAAKLGLQSLTLIPLPLPGGGSIAHYRGEVSRMKDAYQLKVSGSPEKFSDIVARMRGVRDNAQRQATGAEPALAA